MSHGGGNLVQRDPSKRISMSLIESIATPPCPLRPGPGVVRIIADLGGEVETTEAGLALLQRYRYRW